MEGKHVHRSGSAVPWWLALTVAAALLILPLAAWFLFPSVSGGPRDAAASASADLDGEGTSTTTSTKRRSVAGIVVDEHGEPVEGARVVLTENGTTVISGFSTRRGRFTLRGPDRPLKVTASMPGRASAQADVTDPGNVRDIELMLGAGGEEPAPAESTGPVSGVVVDPEGKPLAEAYVVCANNPRLNAISDAQGAFTIASGADGCEAAASHPEHGTSATVTLHAGKANRIEFQQPGMISGSVVDEKGKPVTSFNISIDSYASPSGERDTSLYRSRHFDSPSGEFTFDKLEPGQYVLAASAEGHPPQKSRPVQVEAGQRARGVQITFETGATLSGLVYDRENNQPIEGVRVRLDAVTGGPGSVFATTDATGHYTLAGVPAGPFSVRYSHESYKERIVSLDASSSATIKQDVDLAKRGDGPDMEMSGIGASLSQGSRFVEVSMVLPGGPAEAAGVQAGDRIERIEGRSAESLSVNDCVQRLRGPEGTRVSVTLGRGNQHIDLTMTRARIER